MKIKFTPNPLTGDYWYTTAQIMAALGVSRSRVSALAREHRWRRRMVGNAALYAAHDVETYGMARMRRELAKALGWQPAGLPLVWHDEWDIDCPTPDCDQFAIEFEGRWRCAGGHEGSSGGVCCGGYLTVPLDDTPPT